VPKRLFVAEWEGTVYRLVNPSLHSIGTAQEAGEEGCLSLPGSVGTVLRLCAVMLWATNERGQRLALMATGLLARCFQHELDHLNGIMFTEKLVPGTTLRPVELASEAQPALAMVGGV
jgi:peptide deformylase